MFRFFKRLFSRKKHENTEDIAFRFTENLNNNNSYGFSLVLGFNVAPGEGAIDINVSQVALFSTNEIGRQYINSIDDELLKHTVSTLCLASSMHVNSSQKRFVKPSELPEYSTSLLPAGTDKSKLN